ncbi:hypothetical protein R3P38DRAFT_3202153 [Favolaschia claudopus]|uniref:Uncharacterized protein n=1 Tax=Favolaschia claudopus TaxID=2862362 RepID=A0AAW0AUU3_9AGAR
MKFWPQPYTSVSDSVWASASPSIPSSSSTCAPNDAPESDPPLSSNVSSLIRPTPAALSCTYAYAYTSLPFLPIRPRLGVCYLCIFHPSHSYLHIALTLLYRSRSRCMWYPITQPLPVLSSAGLIFRSFLRHSTQAPHTFLLAFAVPSPLLSSLFDLVPHIPYIPLRLALLLVLPRRPTAPFFSTARAVGDVITLTLPFLSLLYRRPRYPFRSSLLFALPS